MLDATIQNTKIFGLNYANCIVGPSAAINSFGIIQAINELYHQDAQMGVPKKIIARAILDCQTLNEAENIIKKIPRSAGYNHVLVQKDCLWNIETSAEKYVIEKIFHQKYVHTNHYLTKLKQNGQSKNESQLRYAKVTSQLDTINTLADLKIVLSDKNPPPICRQGTLASIIFDSGKNTAYIAYGHPSPDNYFKHHLIN